MAPSKERGRRKFDNKNEGKTHFSNSAMIDLPDKYLLMKVNNGTKIRNVLGHALKVFPQKYDNIIWTGTGKAIGKVISCVEMFKRKNPGLHQVTKLRHLNIDSDDKNTDTKKLIPEINIFLLKNASNVSEPEFQRICKVGIFPNSSIDSDIVQPIKMGQGIGNMGVMSGSVADEFEAMGLRTGRKRSRKSQTGGNFLISKKSKNIENNKKPAEL